MSFALLQTALLMPAELALNKLLTLDAATAARLQSLQGKTLAVHLSQPTFVLYVCVSGAGLRLSPVFEGQPDASLHGSVPALLKLLARGATHTNLHMTNVELRGNTSFVQQLQHLLLDLDIDWEFQLSRLIGNLPTSLVSSGFNQVADFAKTSGTRLKQNLQDYLQEESNLLPRVHELDAFYSAINELALRVDRLQARADLLSSKVKK
ncbi:MAG: SCP2 sterol-binding domain-containing protein [Pseudomonadota bacterium]